MKAALFVARFQPLHKGHLHVMKSILKKYRLVIVIGSINKKDKENPFSYNSKKRMINESLKDYKSKYRIIGIKDVHDDKKWASVIEKKARFDLVVTGSRKGKSEEWVKRCFPDKNIIRYTMFYSKKYNGTKIRKLIREGKKWEHLVPEECVEIINSSKL